MPTAANAYGRQSIDPGASATPTLRDEPCDVPLQGKNPKHPKSEEEPGEDIEDEPSVQSPKEVDQRSESDVLIVDWEGPDDPENPKK